MTYITKHLLATTSALFVCAAPGFVLAQSSGSDTETGSSAQTEQTAGNEQTTQDNRTGGADDMTASSVTDMTSDQSGNMDDRMASQTVMLDMEAFAQQIYERGFRQGYVSGAADVRNRVALQIQQAQNEQMQRQRAGGQGNQYMQGASQNAQPSPEAQKLNPTGQQNASMNQQGSDGSGNATSGQRTPISDEVAARPGGSIIVLPPGVSPEAFISRLMQENDSNRQNSQQNSGQ